MVHPVTGTQSPSSEDSGPLTGADMEKLLTEEEKIRLAALLRDRKADAMSSGDLMNPNLFEAA